MMKNLVFSIGIFVSALFPLFRPLEQGSDCPLTPNNIHNLHRLRTIYRQPKERTVGYISISPQGELLAISVPTKGIMVYSLKSFHPVSIYYPQPNHIVAESIFISEKTLMVTEHNEVTGSSIYLWEMKPNTTLLAQGINIHTLSSSPSGNRFAFFAENFSKSFVHEHGLSVNTMNYVVVWNLAEARPDVILPNLKPRYIVGETTALSFSPDETLLVTSDYMGNISVIDVVNYQLLQQYYNAQFTITDLAFHPDGTMFATTSRERNHSGSVYFWNINDFFKIKAIHLNRALNRIAFSHDGTLLALSGDKQIIIYDAQTFTPLATLPTSHYFTDIAFLPQNNFLVTASTTAGVQLWGIHCDE